MSADCGNSYMGLQLKDIILLFHGFLIVLFSVPGSMAKSNEPIIIILGQSGIPFPINNIPPSGQIESTLSDRDSSGSTRSSAFNLFRSSMDKKEEKKGPHIIFIGGSPAIPTNNNPNMNNNQGGGPMVNSIQGQQNNGQGMGGNGANTGMNNFGPNNNNANSNTHMFSSSPINLAPSPMRRGSTGHGVTLPSPTNNYAPYPITGGSVSSGSMVSSYPYLPYMMSGYGGSTVYPSGGYDYTDYGWSSWKR